MATTQQIFDNFYNTTITINGNDYEIVYSYFRSVAATDTIARNFTSFLFVISQNTGIPVQDLLAQIKGTKGLETDATIAYYLNAIRGGVILYGVAATPVPNNTVQRNVLA